MSYDKDKPAASTSLRASNPQILANQAAIETALNREHTFSTGGTATDQAHHKKGSARAYFQDTAPATRIDGEAFTADDLGSLWFDTNSTPDNVFSFLSATTPTWTPVSTEIIATLLASNRVFARTLGVTGNFAVNTNKFTVDAATGNVVVAGTLDVTGNIDPTTFETTNGGFLDEDDMASNAANKVASQQSIKAFGTMVPAVTGAGTGYAGEESITFPNGLIMKFGEESVATDTTDDVTYEDAFPTAFLWANVSYKGAFDAIGHDCTVQPKSGSEKSILQVTNGHSTITIYWMAVGY